MKTLKKIIWTLLNQIGLGASIQLVLSSSLKESGWFLSFKEKQAIDAKKSPIPWLTYSFIKFIEPRLKDGMSVLEFGTGNSTLWFAERVKLINAIEHDSNWYEQMKKKIPKNVILHFRKESESKRYIDSLKDESIKYDIIINDAVHRNIVAFNCFNSLKEDGVIIFDNTQVVDYREGIDYLLGIGFKKIDFIGMLPIISCDNTTTIFYRNNNCLGI